MEDATRIATGENGLPEITLPDGRVVAFTRKHKAKDSAYAHDQAKNGNQVKLGAALLSRIVTIDGAPAKMEDLLDLYQEDYNLVQRSIPGNFTE